MLQKTKLTINFMKRKLREYDELKNEIYESKTQRLKKQPLKKIDQNLL